MHVSLDTQRHKKKGRSCLTYACAMPMTRGCAGREREEGRGWLGWSRRGEGTSGSWASQGHIWAHPAGGALR
eukprot:715921-Pyramimonas_sp.AAC.1